MKKHWELAGTKIGNILGIKAKEDPKVRVALFIVMHLVCQLFKFFCINYIHIVPVNVFQCIYEYFYMMYDSH